MSPREAIAQARALLGDMSGSIESAPTAELVRLGADLWTIANQVRARVEVIKDLLRARSPLGLNQHLLNGPGATCLITPQSTVPVFRKDVPVAKLRAILGEDFDLLFEVTEMVTPRGEFEEALQRVSSPERVTAVLAALDLVAHKPRVSFQLKGDSNPSPRA